MGIQQLNFRKVIIILVVLTSSVVFGYFAGQGQYRLLGLPVVISVGLVLVAKPRWALYIFILLIPLEWQARLIAGAGLFRLVGIGVFGVWTLRKLMYREKLQTGPLNLPLFVFLGICALSFFYVDSDYSDRWLLQMQAYLQLVAFVLMVRDQLENEQHFKIALAFYTGGALLGAVISVNEYLTFNQWEYYRRVGGVAGDSNASALTYLYSFPLVMYWFSNTFSWVKRLFFLAMLGLIVFATLITVSRTGMIVLAVTIVLYILTVTYRSLGVRKSVGVLFSFVLAFLVLSNFIPWENITYRFAQEGSATEGAELGGRLGAFEFYADEIAKSPIWGQGLGARLYIASHNHLIGVAFQLGLIGLITFIGLWWISWRCINYAIRVADQLGELQLKHLFLSFRITFICLFIFSMTLSAEQSQYLWMSFALSEACYTIVTKKTHLDSQF